MLLRRVVLYLLTNSRHPYRSYQTTRRQIPGDSNLFRHCNRFTSYFTQFTYYKWHVIRDVPRSGWFSCSALYVNSGATFFESRTGHQISWLFFFFARSLFGPGRSRDILSISPRMPRSGFFRIYHSPAILPLTLYNRKFTLRWIYKILSSCTECIGRNVPYFGRTFVGLNYINITKHSRSWTVTEIRRLMLKVQNCYRFVDCQIHETRRNL